VTKKWLGIPALTALTAFLPRNSIVDAPLSDTPVISTVDSLSPTSPKNPIPVPTQTVVPKTAAYEDRKKLKPESDEGIVWTGRSKGPRALLRGDGRPAPIGEKLGPGPTGIVR